MTVVRLTPRAGEVLERVRRARSGALAFTIDGGCCEGTAPHLFENPILAPGSEPAAEVAGVPVYLQPAMAVPLADADLVIDVVDDELSDAMSAETEFGVRFVLREGPACVVR